MITYGFCRFYTINVHFNYVDVKMSAVYSRKDLWENIMVVPVFIYNIINIPVDFYQLWLNFKVTSTKNIDVISTTLFQRFFDVASTKNIDDTISTSYWRRFKGYDVVTTFQRIFDVIPTSCAHWVVDYLLKSHIFANVKYWDGPWYSQY